MSRLYDFTDYDKYFSLKVSAELWFIILYLLRPYLALIGSRGAGDGGATLSSAKGIRNILYPDDFSLVLALLATAPVLLFMFVWSRRKPDAGELVKKLWHKGATLLVVAAVLNIVIVFIPLLTGIVARIHALGWVQVCMAVAIIIYLFSSRRVRDTFADFPVEKAE